MAEKTKFKNYIRTNTGGEQEIDLKDQITNG